MVEPRGEEGPPAYGTGSWSRLKARSGGGVFADFRGNGGFGSRANFGPTIGRPHPDRYFIRRA